MNLHNIETVLTAVITFSSHILEVCGALIILYAGLKAFLCFVQSGRDGREIRLLFARFLVFGLEFKLGAEILRTVVVRTLQEILVLAAIIALRFILNLILHWEIHQEKRDEADELWHKVTTHGRKQH